MNANDAPPNLTDQTQGCVPRELTQERLDRRAAASALIKPADLYTLADRVEETARRQGERPFLLYGGQRFSYAEVDARANQVAHAAFARGLRPGDVCALAMENRPDFFFTWFGLTKLGVVVAFINTQVSGRPLVHALETTQARAAVVGEECLANFAATEGLPDLPLWGLADAEKPCQDAAAGVADMAFTAEVSAAPREAFPRSHRAAITAETPTLLIFTSGTTGLPKAARYSHMRWLSSGDVMEVTIGATPDDVFYCCLPLYHGAAATSVTSTALRAGAAIALRRKFSTREFWKDVRSHGITVCQYIGEICRYLMNQPPSPDDRRHSLRCMMGAGLTPEIWQRWIERFGSVQIFEGWGSTEANTALINLDNRIGSCGRVPFWEKTNLRLVRYDQEKGDYIRDENGFLQLAGVNEPGEAIGMVIQYPGVVAGRFEGYTSEEASEKKLLRNVFQQGDVWWTSGDLLRCDEDGYCWFVDRIGDTFRWKSENVSTMEVSDALGDYQGLDAITVYGVQVPGHGGRAGMAALVMHEGAQFDPKAFWKMAIARLPRYAAPLFVRLMDTPDMTGNYKLRKVDLQKQGYDSAQTGDPLFVRNDKLQTYVPLTAATLEEALRG